MTLSFADSVCVAITGSGGSGVVTIGEILLLAAGKVGHYGLMRRSSGPQIRGGESAIYLRLGTTPVQGLDDRFQLLLALDWRNVERFLEDIPLDGDSRVLRDPAAGPVPAAIVQSGAQVVDIPLAALARSAAEAAPFGAGANMVGLGVVGRLLGLPPPALADAVRRRWGTKGAAIARGALTCLEQGLAQGPGAEPLRLPAMVDAVAPRRWNISGNEACGLGALQAGVRFVAAYPITPATEMLEWLAPPLENMGGCLLQAEDELAAINAVIGASFGGVPALTATSGPGLSLMMEGIGLAIASETPAVVVDVMRIGPSTGIPTKSEQGDLNIALHGLHGEAPHLVLAPLDVSDCVFTTRWAVGLAEQLQTVAIVLSDQALGQARAIIDPPTRVPPPLARRVPPPDTVGYRRYAPTDDAIAPMARPGMPDYLYTADGLEHDERGIPSSLAADHVAQLDRRQRKLARFAYGEAWADVDGDGEVALVTWGSTTGTVREAADRLRSMGLPVKVVGLRLLNPLPEAQLRRALAGCGRILVVEQNHSAQLYRHLCAHEALPPIHRSLARPGPAPLRPNDVVAAVAGWKP